MILIKSQSTCISEYQDTQLLRCSNANDLSVTPSTHTHTHTHTERGGDGDACQLHY